MNELILAATAFVLMHLLVSGTRLRDTIVGTVGAGPYMGLYSLASVLGLTWVGFAFAAARGGPTDVAFWPTAHLALWIQLGVQFVAVVFIVVGLTTPNPTSVAQEGLLGRPGAARGLLRVTRHPFLWGVALWAAGHLLVNGSAAAVVLFGSMLALALFGTASIDEKRRRALGPLWAGFAAETSNVPFAAILAGRQTLRIGEIGWWRPLLAILVFAGVLAGHWRAFRAYPLPF